MRRLRDEVVEEPRKCARHDARDELSALITLDARFVAKELGRHLGCAGMLNLSRTCKKAQTMMVEHVPHMAYFDMVISFHADPKAWPLLREAGLRYPLNCNVSFVSRFTKPMIDLALVHEPCCDMANVLFDTLWIYNVPPQERTTSITNVLDTIAPLPDVEQRLLALFTAGCTRGDWDDWFELGLAYWYKGYPALARAMRKFLQPVFDDQFWANFSMRVQYLDGNTDDVITLNEYWLAGRRSFGIAVDSFEDLFYTLVDDAVNPRRMDDAIFTLLMDREVFFLPFNEAFPMNVPSIDGKRFLRYLHRLAGCPDALYTYYTSCDDFILNLLINPDNMISDASDSYAIYAWHMKHIPRNKLPWFVGRIVLDKDARERFRDALPARVWTRELLEDAHVLGSPFLLRVALDTFLPMLVYTPEERWLMRTGEMIEALPNKSDNEKRLLRLGLVDDPTPAHLAALLSPPAPAAYDPSSPKYDPGSPQYSPSSPCPYDPRDT